MGNSKHKFHLEDEVNNEEAPQAKILRNMTQKVSENRYFVIYNFREYASPQNFSLLFWYPKCLDPPRYQQKI